MWLACFVCVWLYVFEVVYFMVVACCMRVPIRCVVCVVVLLCVSSRLFLVFSVYYVLCMSGCVCVFFVCLHVCALWYLLFVVY